MGAAPGKSVPGCPLSTVGGMFFFPPLLSAWLFPVLAGVLPVFALHTELQNAVQLCPDGGNSTRIQNPGLVPDPATEAPQDHFIAFASF